MQPDPTLTRYWHLISCFFSIPFSIQFASIHTAYPEPLYAMNPQLPQRSSRTTPFSGERLSEVVGDRDLFGGKQGREVAGKSGHFGDHRH